MSSDRDSDSAAAAVPGKAPAKAAGRQKRLTPEERRQDFVDKAVAFFAEVGFDGGTRELARRLGVTQPLLYRYFPTKDDLIREVYDQVYVNRWNPEWDVLLADRARPLRQRLQDFYEAYTDAIFTREWMRIYLFSGLKGVEINKWYVTIVEDRILKRIVLEYRAEAGLPTVEPPSSAELELGWILHGGIFYYGLRKHIYEIPVMENKARVIANALDVFLEGAAHMFGAGIKVRTTRVRPAQWAGDLG
ncbi:TetR/AcrR family transcriptional regulator [Breoghania sp. L-A4]|uniref:TetR/AcrR family transcriptional regulator n=1 Tax=Breoghania sp. L-A4 TaxID=2304600 RepID=UPI000E35EB94|nr:TetR/AcrR family transcriptional regulator [Breoghania sp. L-A4]AXS41774.1 TetR/AcrR family transcriptional regulator [Breoghania sp. L-A4]